MNELEELSRAGDHPLMYSFPHGAVFAFDHDLRYLSAGGNGLADVGLSREMLEGHTIFEVFPPETAATIEPLYRAALRGETSTFDVPFQDRIYSQRLAPIADASGQPIAGLGFTQDVTAARTAEHSLRESEQRLRLTFEHAPIGEALVELDGRWRRVNAAVTALTGYSETELQGMTFQDITHPDDLDLHHLAQLVAGEITSYQIEKRYFTASGATVWVLLSVTLVRDDELEPLYFIAQIQDITDAKRQRDALEDLTAMLAHDLRAPTAVIAGFIELMLDSWGNQSERDQLSILRRVHTAAQAMQVLLENSLTVSALGADVVVAKPTSVRFDDAVRDALAGLPDEGLQIDVTDMRPVWVWIDPAHLTQVLHNLITNAIKYGGGALRIRTDLVAETVTVVIEDNGPGVSPEFVPHLFERFSRSAEARASDERGTGLGLYIVRDLLDRNDGQVSYQRSPKGGARFTIVLPTYRALSDTAS
jgi:PAS domain S-box-containing protein